jgi:hypothetical protein
MPLADLAPLLAVLPPWVGYWVHLPILIAAISLVYAGTRFDDWPNILKEARRWVVRLVSFLAVVVLVLYLLSLWT